jgi:hypothetical protein
MFNINHANDLFQNVKSVINSLRSLFKYFLLQKQRKNYFSLIEKKPERTPTNVFE